jgi:hypothetical protein
MELPRNYIRMHLGGYTSQCPKAEFESALVFRRLTARTDHVLCIDWARIHHRMGLATAIHCEQKIREPTR